MSFNLNSLWLDWRAKVPDGTPNPSNAYHLVLLKELCLKQGIDREIIDNVMLVMEKDEKIDPDTPIKYKLKNKNTGEMEDKETTYKSAIQMDKEHPAYIAAKALQSDDGKKEKDKIKPMKIDPDGGLGPKDGDSKSKKKTVKHSTSFQTTSGEVKNKALDQKIDTLKEPVFSSDKTGKTDADFKKDNAKYVAKKKINFTNNMKQFEPHKFPKKYLKVLGRMLNTRLYDQVDQKSMRDGAKVKRPISQLSHYTNEGGAGEIYAQAGELLGMLGSSIQDPDDRKQFYDMIEKHMISNDDELIAKKGWLKAARRNNRALDDHLTTKYPGGYEVVASAWDVNSEAEALGLKNVGENKGFSTDQYMKVRDKQTNKVYLEEISLKKDKNIRLTNSSPEAVVDFKNFSDAEIKTFAKNLQKLKGIVDVPPPGDKAVDIKDVRFDSYKNYQSEQYTKFFSKPSKKKQLIALIKNGTIKKKLKALKIDPNNPDERIDYLLSGKGDTRDRNSLLMTAASQITGGQNVINKVNKNTQNVIKNITLGIGVDPAKTKMVSAVREKLPLHGLVSGEESMAIDDVMIDKNTLSKVFGIDLSEPGTTNFEKIKDNLEVDPKGYTHVARDGTKSIQPVIKYKAKGTGKTFVVSKIVIREDGKGYGSAMKFDMKMDNEFMDVCREAHETELTKAKRAK
jgi:hypothetical protein